MTGSITDSVKQEGVEHGGGGGNAVQQDSEQAGAQETGQVPPHGLAFRPRKFKVLFLY